ncbi:MAG: histidine--tRNA ligase [Candidatus Dormibacteria bacterium]
MPGISRPRGTDDLMPERLAAMEHAVTVGMGISDEYGYRRLETPIFESTDLFVRGVGDTTDVVSREMYTFADRGGRSLTLRPEGTASTVRAFWESELRQEPLPVRLSYAGPMFRYDRPGRGRYRQFNQFGVEVLGEDEPELDAEVIAVAWRWLRELGVTGTSLQLNSIGDGICRPRYRQALLDFFEPHLAQLDRLDQERLRRNPLRILDSKELASASLLDAAPKTTDFLCDDCRAAFERVLGALDAYGIDYQLNPLLVRGLDYYARTTFEVWHEDLKGAQNSLFGGGRYDGLSQLLGYPPCAGVGFAAGLERVVLLSPPLAALPKPPVWVLGAQLVAAKAVIETAERLRRAGIRVVSDPGRRSLKSKMRSAERGGAALVAIVGEDELARGVVALRRLQDGTQVESGLTGLEAAVTSLLAEFP